MPSPRYSHPTRGAVSPSTLGIHFPRLEMAMQHGEGGEDSTIFAPVECSLMSTTLTIVETI